VPRGRVLVVRGQGCGTYRDCDRDYVVAIDDFDDVRDARRVTMEE